MLQFREPSLVVQFIRLIELYSIQPSSGLLCVKVCEIKYAREVEARRRANNAGRWSFGDGGQNGECQEDVR